MTHPARCVPFLLVPGWTGSGPDHWQSHWERKDPRFRRVEQDDWDRPSPAEWMEALDRQVAAAEGSVVLIAHSLGCIALAQWAPRAADRVVGALLVAPADVEREDAPAEIRGFSPVPRVALPFPSLLVSSTDDPYLDPSRAAAFARAWGSRHREIGAAGHVNTASGFGLWPEGLAMLDELVRSPAGDGAEPADAPRAGRLYTRWGEP